MMNRSVLYWSATAALACGVLSPAMARPAYLQAFKAHYKTASGKPTLDKATCALCHVGAPAQAKWNAYGEAVRGALGAKGVTDRAKIEAALVAAESKKAGAQTFGQLINADKMPGAMAAAGGTPPPAGGGGQPSGQANGVWQPIYNGVNMDGWHKMNQGNWVVENQILKYTGGGNGWLRSDKQYKNYSMVVVWRYPNPGNNDAGLFLKASDQGNPWPDGANWQLNMGPGDNFGTISGAGIQGARARGDLIKRNDWNTYAITVENGIATLTINGQVAWDMATGIPDKMGYVGFQAEGFPLEIAQVWLMPLP